ncbi:PhoH-like phosphate starvation-inducible [Pseudoalteromonas phage pYD6-A]|uniref:Phosphate starvation-inducible protein n=1 Tax=Pseudoalteromonas phage pYD6-A TaxID=754052 RepID=M4SNK7_9CAUD|nr:PhoH-like phosphate starvation-inducible [Pseudoalteromonas phage pYD6-A]AGH57618.1 phosphate starvation-inducible protein [Pseudoalteromonas phage pYD6-A]
MTKRNKSDNNSRAKKVEASFKPVSALKPKNEIQSHFINYINTAPVTIATGHAGTGKTYIPTRIASQWLKQKAIDKIVLVRPAASASNSLGFFKGTKEEKMTQWLQPILSTLREEFSPGQLEYLMSEEIAAIDFCPLETAKGNSWKNAFVIVDEAEDCNIKEIKTLLTRIGENSTLCICGDINQVDIQKSGVGEFLEVRNKSRLLQEAVKHVDFCDYEDIVRSDTVRDIIMGWDEADGLVEIDYE